MKLWPIQHDGSVDVPYVVPEVVKPVLATFPMMYDIVAYRPPWIGYLVSEADDLVGTEDLGLVIATQTLPSTVHRRGYSRSTASCSGVHCSIRKMVWFGSGDAMHTNRGAMAPVASDKVDLDAALVIEGASPLTFISSL